MAVGSNLPPRVLKALSHSLQRLLTFDLAVGRQLPIVSRQSESGQPSANRRLSRSGSTRLIVGMCVGRPRSDVRTTAVHPGEQVLSTLNTHATRRIACLKLDVSCGRVPSAPLYRQTPSRYGRKCDGTLGPRDADLLRHELNAVTGWFSSRLHRTLMRNSQHPRRQDTRCPQLTFRPN